MRYLRQRCFFAIRPESVCLCKEGRIEDAEMLSRIWAIPEDVEKPARKQINLDKTE